MEFQTNIIISRCNKDISVENIAKIVSAYYELPREDLNLKTRKREIVTARQMTWYIIKKLKYKIGLVEMGKLFHDKDHTTVMHGVKTINNLLAVSDKDIMEDAANLIALVNEASDASKRQKRTLLGI